MCKTHKPYLGLPPIRQAENTYPLGTWITACKQGRVGNNAIGNKI